LRFLLDENVNTAAMPALAATFLSHEFVRVGDQRWLGATDGELFHMMRDNGFGAIITKDRNQLTDPTERAVLRSCGLHWVGLRARSHRGLPGLALETASILAGLPFVLDRLGAGLEPTAFHLMGVPSEHTQRVKSEPL
jgi:hypothetical protein